MEYIVPLLVFFAFFLGMTIRHWVPEEANVRKKYVPYFEKVLLLLLIFVSFYFYFAHDVLLYVSLVAGIALGIFYRKIYLYFGLVLVSLNFYVAVIQFLFGLVHGHKKRGVHNALRFFAPFLLLLYPPAIPYGVFVGVGACMSLLFLRKIY